jgi:CRP/FNR family transcriptional regulator
MSSVPDFAVLDGLPLFAGLSNATRRSLARAAVERSYAAGATLFRAGTVAAGLYIVLSGRVRVIRSRDGRQYVVHTEGPGGTLGEVPFFEQGSFLATAVASEPTRCLMINREALRAIMRNDSAVAWLFLRRLSARIRELVERLDRASTQGIPARLAAFLLTRSDRAQPFTLGMTQAALAEELGTVREVIVRALAQLRALGVIAPAGRGRYVVRDLAALTKLAES